MTFWPQSDVAQQLPALRRYARALTQDAIRADDLVQQCLLRALERADSFRPGAALLPWLLAILHNQFVSDQRRSRVERAALTEIAQLPAMTDAGPAQVAELAEISARFAALSETHRSILHLIVIEGLSYQDAAAALSVPIGTVMSRLSRARAALRGAEPASARTNLRIVGGRDAD